MFYERPRLVNLTGKAWDAAGACGSGISTTITGGMCQVGVHAPTGPCSVGTGPDPDSSCNFGDSDANRCTSGGNADGDAPRCATGYAPQGVTGQCHAGYGGTEP